MRVRFRLDVCSRTAIPAQVGSGEEFVKTECKRAMYAFLEGLVGLHDLFCRGLTEAESMHQPFHVRQKCRMLNHLVEDQLFMWGTRATVGATRMRRAAARSIVCVCVVIRVFV